MPQTPVISVRLVERPVEYRPLDVVPKSAGAECVFLGRTRVEIHPEHGRLMRLSYDAYLPMAERSLRELAQQAVERFHCLAVRIEHAVGIVPPGEASVLVQVACGHRAESFEACRFLIDELKRCVPIWKLEVWEDGTTWSQGSAVAAAETTS